MDIYKDNKQTLDRLSYRKLHLYSDYRIVNSNYKFGQGAIPYIKHGPYRQQLEALLANSDGGAILVTGFRGVGKSTMAHNAISALNQTGHYRMIPISVALPAEKTYGQVLVEIIRRLYETLKNGVFWDELENKTQQRISLAHNRTLLNIKQSNNLAVEGELSMQAPLEWLPSVKAKGSGQQAEEKSYLLFSEQDIEYELTQCIEALHKANRKNRVIIIIDEIDKLTATKDGVICFDNLLERMKSLISSTNALFVFIAGIEIYKRWENDRQKINSLYDSLFSHHIYLPCIWDSVEELFDVIKDINYVYQPVAQEFRGLVRSEHTSCLEPPFQIIANYILFKGKGLPQKILRVFNDFVTWDDKQPCFLLIASRIRAILQVNKLLEKFYKFKTVQKISNLFDRDIYYSLFFSLLEFLIYQEKLTFTEAQIQEVLLDDKSPLEWYIKGILTELLVEFNKLAFIKRTETGFEIIDNTILNRDPSLRILDQDLLIGEASDEELPKHEDTSVNERFHNQIKMIHSADLSSFWDNYSAEELIVDAANIMIFRVTTLSSGSQRYAVIYKKRKQTDLGGESQKRLDDLYSGGTYRFSGPCFLDSEDYIDSGFPVTSLRTAVNGYVLEHLIEAKLEWLTVYRIIHQVLSTVDYLHEKGFGNVRLKPDNIIVCKDSTIKILDLTHLHRLNYGCVSRTTRIYSAPEVYLSECTDASDYYSAGILLVEMIVGKSLSRHYVERHINVEGVLSEATCSQRMKDILVKATAFDPADRYKHSDDLIKALNQCPEFRGMKKIPIPKSKDGTVSGHDIRGAVSIVPADIGDGQTTILGGAYFDTGDTTMLNMKSRSKAAYLVRQSNNERIVLNKSVFRIGRNQTDVDYCLNNMLISGLHAEFSRNEDMFNLKDLGSMNRTYVNSERLEPNKAYRINHGDRIRMADEEFIFYER